MPKHTNNAPVSGLPEGTDYLGDSHKPNNKKTPNTLANLNANHELKKPEGVDEIQVRKYAISDDLEDEIGDMKRFDPKLVAKYVSSVREQEAEIEKNLLAWATYRESPEGLQHLKDVRPKMFQEEVEFFEKQYERDTKLHEILIRANIETEEELNFIYDSILDSNAYLSPFPGFDPQGRFLGGNFWKEYFENRQLSTASKEYGLIGRYTIGNTMDGFEREGAPGLTEAQLKLKAAIVKRLLNPDSVAYNEFLARLNDLAGRKGVDSVWWGDKTKKAEKKYADTANYLKWV